MTVDLRDKDIAVLRAIENGATDTREIREATTLTIREINYSIDGYSLEALGLIEVTREQGREWRKIDGQEKNVWKPKQVRLTNKGIRTLAALDTLGGDQYEELSKRELIEQVQELETRLDRLETVFKDFRATVMEQL